MMRIPLFQPAKVFKKRIAAKEATETEVSEVPHSDYEEYAQLDGDEERESQADIQTEDEDDTGTATETEMETQEEIENVAGKH